MAVVPTGLSLQPNGGQGIANVVNAVPSLGAQAKSPANNVPKTPTTLPANQVAKPATGSLQALINSSPTTAANFGTVPTTSPTASPSTGTLAGVINPVGSNNAPQNASQPATPAPSAATTPPVTAQGYTPPNQGTTGVSQGGLIGNLVNQSQAPSAAYTTAEAQLAATQAQIAQLTQTYNQANTNAGTAAGFEGESQGQQGQLNQLYQANLATLQAQAQQQSNVLAAANTQQGLQVQAGTAAASANAPVFASPGQVQVNPSAPTPGSTTSGAASLNSLIGTRPSATSPGTTEYYNTSTGQGFATPTDLAMFVNQQTPGANVTPANVFSYLQQNGGAGSNILGLPASTMAQYAKMLVSGQGSSIPSSVTGNAALMAQLQQQAQDFTGGTFNNNTAAGQGAAQQSNASTVGEAPVTANNAVYQSATAGLAQLTAANQNYTQFGNLLLSTIPTSAGISPTSSQWLNQTINGAQTTLAGSPALAQYNTTVAELQKTAQSILAAGQASGSTIPSDVTNYGNAILDGSMPLSQLTAAMNRLGQEGVILQNTLQTVKTNAHNAMTAGSTPAPVGSNNAGAGGSGFGWSPPT